MSWAGRRTGSGSSFTISTGGLDAGGVGVAGFAGLVNGCVFWTIDVREVYAAVGAGTTAGTGPGAPEALGRGFVAGVFPGGKLVCGAGLAGAGRGGTVSSSSS